MRRRMPTLFLLIVLLIGSLSGCVDDHQLLSSVHEYFPGAALFKFDKRVLWIQTEVDGVSPKFAEKTFLNFLEEADKSTAQKSFGIINFSDALAHDGYVYLVLGFKQGVVAWDRRPVVQNGERVTFHWNLTWEQAPTWFVEHVGYFPTKEQIVEVDQ